LLPHLATSTEKRKLNHSVVSSWLLDVKRGLHASLGRLLRRAYAAQIFRHPEVYHAWCELVVLHQLVWLQADLRQFLLEHQGMGLYLYGELAVSQSRLFQKLVRYRAVHYGMRVWLILMFIEVVGMFRLETLFQLGCCSLKTGWGVFSKLVRMLIKLVGMLT
jgi:hypothetical protein